MRSNQVFVEINIGLADSFPCRSILNNEQGVKFGNLWALKKLALKKHAVKDYVVSQMAYMDSQTQSMIIILVDEGMNCFIL